MSKLQSTKTLHCGIGSEKDPSVTRKTEHSKTSHMNMHHDVNACIQRRIVSSNEPFERSRPRYTPLDEICEIHYKMERFAYFVTNIVGNIDSYMRSMKWLVGESSSLLCIPAAENAVISSSIY